MTKVTAELKSGVVQWAIRGLSYKAFVALVLMLSAGRWDWWPGWAYVAVFLLFDLATALVVIPRSPELLIERSTRQPDVVGWDKVIMPVAAGLLPMVAWIVAGLNDRFDWQPTVPVFIQWLAWLFVIVGHGILVWAMAANAYFSPVVRIQTERDHRVAKQGPYRIVRHPGYLGAILFTVALPLALQSWWALIPALINFGMYLLRTFLEDGYLHQHLPGYRDYAMQVPHRLLPGIW